MLNLKEVYGKRYRIQLDAAYEAETFHGKTTEIGWYYELVGLYGQIYPHSESHLQVWLNPRLGTALKRNLPMNWHVTQNSSDGLAFSFPNSDISVAFKWIKPRKRRIGRPAPHLSKYHFKPKGAV